MATIGSVATRERELRSAATVQARALYREQGVRAVEFLTARIARQDASPEERRRDRLARLEVERLDRTRRNGPSTALVAWKPPLFSVEGIKRLLGFGRRSGRR